MEGHIVSITVAKVDEFLEQIEKDRGSLYWTEGHPSALNGAEVWLSSLRNFVRAAGEEAAEIEPLAEWERELLAGSIAPAATKTVPADAIVIERGELPVVTDDGAHYVTTSASWPKAMAHKHAAAIRADGLANLALAEYLDAHPPVDEAQVAALTAVVEADFMDPARAEGRDSWESMARRLYLAGVRVGTEATS